MYSSVLNRLFSRATLRSFISQSPTKDYLYAANTFLDLDNTVTNYQVVKGLYRLLLSTHRNEYVYKNTLLNRIVIGRHSPKTSTAFTEVPVRGSIADFVVVNGQATAYEVKTDLDNLDRLDTQLGDYLHAFDRVCVVCGRRHLPELMRRYEGTPFGVVAVTDRQFLSTKKEPDRYMELLDHESLFRLLRRKEYGLVLASCGRLVPNSSPFSFYDDCLSTFAEVPIAGAYSAVMTALKARGREVEIDALKMVPPELKSLGYFIRITHKQSRRLASFLSAPIASMEEA